MMKAAVATVSPAVPEMGVIGMLQAGLHSRQAVWGITAILGLSCLTAWMNLAWLAGIFELLFFGLAFFYLCSTQSSKYSRRFLALMLCAASIPAIGALQIVTHRAAYNYATLQATQYWAVPAACTVIGLSLFTSARLREAFLVSLVWLGLAVTCLEVMQIFQLGRYGVTSSGYPLLSSNYYAELIELVLPVCLVRALRRHRYWWVEAGSAALFVATVMSAGARMGSALVIAESCILLILGQSQFDSRKGRVRQLAVVLALLIAVLAVGEGVGMLSNRFHGEHPLVERRAMAKSAVEMIHQRPFLGYGLGAFPLVYPQFASFDNGYFVNHAHNDYLEIGTESGLLGLCLILIYFGICVRHIWLSFWGIGVIAVLIHSLSDFPMFRSSVIGLTALLASAALARNAKTEVLTKRDLKMSSKYLYNVKKITH